MLGMISRFKVSIWMCTCLFLNTNLSQCQRFMITVRCGAHVRWGGYPTPPRPGGLTTWPPSARTLQSRTSQDLPARFHDDNPWPRENARDSTFHPDSGALESDNRCHFETTNEQKKIENCRSTQKNIDMKKWLRESIGY